MRGAGRHERPRQRLGRSRRGSGRSKAGHRHVRVAADRPEQCSVRVGRVRRVLERPESEKGAVHTFSDGQRAGSHRRPHSVRLFLPNFVHGIRGPRRGGAHVAYRRQNGAVQLGVQLHWGRHKS